MEREEFFKLLLDTLSLSEEVIKKESDFNSFNFDSFSKLSIIMLIDTCLNKTVYPNDLLKCNTFGDIVEMAFAE